ncbi:MAG: glucose-1-phosphate adenylyltransferase [Verrucomicrobiales bacterium]|nr:glucose-1-phosphate adenylyltransferase [Verrucomicrobiales bacterium]|tara:strand:+ start:3600 stop:4901 length:1302 start_codon:yes stop_codon:yes gene_type:complete
MSKRHLIDTSRVLAIVMGGGRGSRLFPLTQDRSKPAVPLVGKYRIVDIPISNCINSGITKVYLLTQFNSASLHRHISQSYKFDHFTGGFVELLAAEQTLEGESWYQGTADAVRKNLVHLENQDWEYCVILSGDQLYRMDFSEVLETHIETKADLTVATLPVEREAAKGFGIMQIDNNRRITRFVEKPQEDEVLDSLVIPSSNYEDLGIKAQNELLLASMGIYVFKRKVLDELLENDLTDFGKDIIPNAITSHRVFSHVFQGYWEDIGTICSYFEANLDSTSELPHFNFFDMSSPMYTRARFLPASKINGAGIDHAVISDGCIISWAQISHSVIGVRSTISPGTRLHRVIALGNDYFESAESIEQHEEKGLPRIGIGANCRIDNAIIDKNARIGDNVTITPEGKDENVDGDNYYIRDGIVVIPKNAVIPSGTVI